jgi:hypothetical protein
MLNFITRHITRHYCYAENIPYGTYMWGCRRFASGPLFYPRSHSRSDGSPHVTYLGKPRLSYLGYLYLYFNIRYQDLLVILESWPHSDFPFFGLHVIVLFENLPITSASSSEVLRVISKKFGRNLRAYTSTRK